jgi:Methyltransferase domain
VKQTNSIARNLGSEFSGLSFVEGNILDYFSLDLPSKNLDGKIAAGEGDVEVVKRGSGDDNEEQNTGNWEKSVKGAMRNLRKKSRKEYLESNKMDILIALHACDTATDDAIWCGIQAGAQIIGRMYPLPPTNLTTDFVKSDTLCSASCLLLDTMTHLILP